MDQTLSGILGTLVMIGLFMLRLPVAHSMMLVGFVGFSLLTSWTGGLNLVSRSIYSSFASLDLCTIPLFILMGQLAFNTGISRKLYDAAYRYLGHVRGGLAMATSVACTAFGTICGSSPATAATMATVGLPEMKRFNYSDRLATGCVAASGGLGMIMPPSVVLLVYGVLTGQSIGALFVAGILPAILLTVLFAATVSILCTRNPKIGPAGERFGWGERLKALTGLMDTLLVFATVVGGLFFGWFTPTEAASVGVIAVTVLSMAKRQLTWEGFKKSLDETLRTSCMVMFLIAGAVVFGKFLAVTRIPFNIATWVGGLDLPPFAIMAVIVAIYFMGGCFMDSLAMIMLTIPVFFPVVMSLGYDPIWFGVIAVMVTEMGVLTPPVGINVYVVYGIAQRILPGISLEDVFKGSLPFVAAVVVSIACLMTFPIIATLLPSLMY
jgi:tripartite ATP-independent transporter DctM subunit